MHKFQVKFSSIIDESIDVDGKYSKIIEKEFDGILFDSIKKRLSIIKLTSCDNGLNALVPLSSALFKAGIEAIIDDDLSRICNRSPIKRWNLMGLPPMTNDLKKNIFLCIIAVLSIIIRYTIILPCRLFLLVSSFLFLLLSAIFGFVKNISREEGTYISVTAGRLYAASMGYVGYYKDRQNQPSGAGIAVSNHLTANDVQILWSDVNYDVKKGYSLTGQKHTGLIGLLEACSSYFLDTLWLERSDKNQRIEFQKNVLEAARNKKFRTILLFPEGYCTNNTKVCQFKKSLFVDNVCIYPIAIKQDPRLGDAFWYEDNFASYTLRLLTSWAIVYHVRYLPVQFKKASENEIEFACRVQKQIANAAYIEYVKDKSTELLKKETARQKQLKITKEKFGLFITEELEKIKKSESSYMYDDKSFSSRHVVKQPLIKDEFYTNIITASTH
ncbi:Phospholipid/glycerol acyltransferase domain-containing protein [Strongyloides ratti]|uniref:Phospholipid/glycerol acyltransferase domain-containing protein n=1 Tax=Strongyloides ratti TaxID=34506 RepID=A0A090MRI4_STRRB|nr:Phospholipid/glycerol acyltransferase domain-containing protein [Strongyloides ratti]CEF60833.1 Phospholipid/glycerol acyltransferase domain-containing protein [Strongyloides ratti]